MRGKERSTRRSAKPAKAKVEAKLFVSRKAPKSGTSRVRDIEKSLAEALEQQTATSEILRVISSSPTDVQPVFDTIVKSAVRLCDGLFSSFFRFDGELIHPVAQHNHSPEALEILRRTFPMRPGRGLPIGRAILDCAVAHVPDVERDPEYRHLDLAHALGWRSALAVPLLREGSPIGGIFVARAEAGPFSGRQIELLKTFADQAVIAIENVRLFTELQQKNEALTQAHTQVSESLEQQTATAEILRVISSSPTDVQPVFDAIVANAVGLCGGGMGAVYRFDGTLVHLVADHNYPPDVLEVLRNMHPRPPRTDQATGRAILTGVVAQIDDTLSDPDYPREIVFAPGGFRAILAVPMLRDGTPIGAIVIARGETGRFPEGHIELLKTFADQAVIAIENVRLFTELQASNRELTTALDTQTATSDILRVISSSPTDVQPVFEAVLASGVRLCGARFGGVFRFDGELIHFVTSYEWPQEQLEAVRRHFPMPPGDGSLVARAIRDRRVVQTPDYVAEARAGAGATLPPWVPLGETGPRSTIAIPMMREGNPLGGIVLARAEPGLFSDQHVALLQMFADQAVIAIENVRLFTELQTSNRELTTALDTQTATSDILRVISRSQTNVQPVFDAIVESAVRLLGAYSGMLTRVAGDQITLAALTSTDDAGDAALRALFPYSLQFGGPHAQAIRARAPVNIADAHTDPRLSEASRATYRIRGSRSQVVVPLLRHDEAVGAIAVTRRDPGGFTDAEIALLQTFADQAVIAIENARLLTEVQARTQELTRSVGELRALGEVGQAISSTLDLQTVLSTIVARATQLSGTDAGVIYEYDEEREVFVPRATEQLEAEIVETMLATPVRKGEGATGRLAEVQEPIQVPDILAAPAESRVRGALVRAGYRALLAVPLVRDEHLLGGLTVIRKATGTFAPEVIELLRTFATQSALAIQNARLFLEIEDKSRQLEAASQHKSEFLANMSHELRTPLNAIIGFSEVLGERMFGELNEKQEEYLKDIHASGQHLLSLINDILDLSKIEAGRMELELTDFHLPQAIENAVVLVRERALRRGITLEQSIDARLGEIRGDERKVKQVLLNLLSNAIKFTPEGGRVGVRAAPVDAHVEVVVSDTGVGIAPEDQEAVFEEFRQVGAAEKRAEGTGLGLALARKFIELHGGRIWVESQIGAGSTFTFTLPVPRGE